LKGALGGTTDGRADYRLIGAGADLRQVPERSARSAEIDSSRRNLSRWYWPEPADSSSAQYHEPVNSNSSRLGNVIEQATAWLSPRPADQGRSVAGQPLVDVPEGDPFRLAGTLGCSLLNQCISLEGGTGKQSPMSLDRLREACGRQWPAIAKAKREAAARLEQIRKIVQQADSGHPIDSEDISVVAFGSLAREEWTSGSDLDWTLLIDGGADPNTRRPLPFFANRWTGLG
jgi:Nucleotidyltransferase domain